METKVIARNKKASHDYEILEKIEAGLQLVGTEVKSVRAGHVSIADSYAMSKQGQLYLYHFHISPFEQGNRFNHQPYRTRKLLLHKKQIIKLTNEVERKQLTLIPLTLYIKNQWVKMELGLCKGKKKYDKRQAIAEQETKKRLAKVMRNQKY